MVLYYDDTPEVNLERICPLRPLRQIATLFQLVQIAICVTAMTVLCRRRKTVSHRGPHPQGHTI